MKYYVFGGTNLDLNAKLDTPVALHESNPCEAKFTYGGVGRNIARAIGNYDFCYFISAFNNSPLMSSLIEDLHFHNVDTTLSKTFITDANSIYINIIDNNGLVVGASDMGLIDKLKISHVKEAISLTREDDIIICDTNLSPQILEYILTHSKGYKVIDSVSSKKLKKVKDIASKFDLIKCNQYEKEMIDLTNMDYIVTYGDGFTVKYQGTKLSCHHKLVNLVNPSGCGDTFFGTFLSNIKKGLKEALTLSIKAASASALTKESVPTLDEINSIKEDELDIRWTYDN